MSRIKYITLLIILLSCTMSIAQNDILIPNRVGSKWGFKTMSGKVKVKAEYDSVSHFTHYIEKKKSAKLAKVKRNGFWGLVNANGTLVIPTKYKQLDEVKIHYNPNYYIAQDKKGKFAILHQEKFLTKFVYDTLNYRYDYVVAQKKDNIGILELSGKEKIPVQYDQIILVAGFLSTRNLEDGWEMLADEIVHEKANIHIKFPKTRNRNEAFCIWSVSDAKETKYIITDEFYGLFTSKLSKLKNKQYEESVEMTVRADTESDYFQYEKRYETLSKEGYSFQENYYRYNRFYTFTKDNNSLLGVYDLEKNRETVPPAYEDIKMSDYSYKGYFVVENDEKYGLFDASGTQLLPVDYDKFENEDTIFIFQKDNLAIFYATKTKKKSLAGYEFLETVPYHEFQKNQQTLLKVKKYGVVFYLDANMNEYYTK
ncbi:MAG: WG repeat-containing protein [Kordia sp.]|uniref:WG repeat-containing protein n=1 Tax=Kordia sp. TaxID=1965332 RepID=UPI00385DEDF0